MARAKRQAKRSTRAKTGSIRARATESAYAARIDTGIASEIEAAVAEGARLRERIEAKIEQRIREE